MKDMPMEESSELPLAALFPRGDPRDALVVPISASPAPFWSVVGSSSPRRKLQLLSLFPEAKIKNVSRKCADPVGKIGTRGFHCLSIGGGWLGAFGAQSSDCSLFFSTQEMIPAAGQGILAIQARKGEDISFL